MTGVRLMDRCDACGQTLPVAEMWRCEDVHERQRLVCEGCRLAIVDERDYEEHADRDLVGSCDCEACYRHRCRCAMREDEVALRGKTFESAEQALADATVGEDIGF